MAELIYKSEAKEIMTEDWFLDILLTQYGRHDIKEEVENAIDRIPTTTESEIRASALKYAQSRFRHTYETMVANKMENCINWADMLDSMVAEQLKEE